MLKEEIREKHLKANGLSVNNTVVGRRIQKAAFDAMDEYGKQVFEAARKFKHPGIDPYVPVPFDYEYPNYYDYVKSNP